MLSRLFFVLSRLFLIRVSYPIPAHESIGNVLEAIDAKTNRIQGGKSIIYGLRKFEHVGLRNYI